MTLLKSFLRKEKPLLCIWAYMVAFVKKLKQKLNTIIFKGWGPLCMMIHYFLIGIG